MVLDIFQMKLGTETVPGMYNDDAKGIVAVKMLDAVQTVVDVLTDNDGKGGWKVGFDPGLNAYTNREDGSPRGIVVSAKALLDAKPGTPMADVAAILTGFAVHEVGHTKMDFFTAVKKRWPGHKLPLILANVIEDVVLEQRTCRDYDGFADHGEGNIFRPALVWIAALTCPTDPLKWDGSTGHKVNVVGQILRYRDFVTFDMGHAPTRDALDYVETWGQGITPDLTPKGCVALIEDILDYMKATTEPEPKDEPETEGGEGEPEPGEGEGDDTEGEGNGQSIPEEDEPDTEGEDGDGDSDDTEGDDGDGDGGDDAGGFDDTEGDSDADGDGEADGEGDTEGEGEGNPGTEDGDGESDSGPVDTTDRRSGGKGETDKHGAGGTGETIAEASDDDFIDDFEPDEIGKSWDDMASDTDSLAQRSLANAEAEERITTRLDGGIHGKMRVIFR